VQIEKTQIKKNICQLLCCPKDCLIRRARHFNQSTPRLKYYNNYEIPTVRPASGAELLYPEAMIEPMRRGVYNTSAVPPHAITRDELESGYTLINGVSKSLKQNRIVYPLIEGAGYALPYKYNSKWGYNRLDKDLKNNMNISNAADYYNASVRLFGDEFKHIQVYIKERQTRRNKNEMRAQGRSQGRSQGTLI